jgi:hypothetical protein
MMARRYVILAALLALAAFGGVAGNWLRRGGVEHPVDSGPQAAEGESGMPSWQGRVVSGGELIESTSPPPQPPPKLVLLEEQYAFGTMDIHESGEHAFAVRNDGLGPLTLAPGTKSCQCTEIHMDDPVVLPGGTGHVRIAWNTGERSGDFHHSGSVYTNDPAAPVIRLRVLGSVREHFGVDTPSVLLSGVAYGEEPTAELIVYSQVWEEFKVSDVRMSMPGLKWEVEPLAASRYGALKVKSAYRLKLRLPATPGVGAFRHELLVEGAPVDGSAPRQTRTVRIEGRVLGRISVFGRGILEGRTIDLGTGPADESRRRRMVLKVTDEHRSLVVQHIETRPAFLQASLKPMESAPPEAGLYQLEVAIPAGTTPCSHFGEQAGELRILTDHPHVPALALRVEFAVTADGGIRCP